MKRGNKMFNYENVLIGEIDVNKLWALYSNVSQWNQWDKSLEKSELNGNFVANSSGIMIMPNMPPLSFTIDTLEANKYFTNYSVIGEIKVEFGHYIIALENGKVEIKHTVTITGGEENQMTGIGKGITASIPSAMQNLFELSEVK